MKGTNCYYSAEHSQCTFSNAHCLGLCLCIIHVKQFFSLTRSQKLTCILSASAHYPHIFTVLKIYLSTESVMQTEQQHGAIRT